MTVFFFFFFFSPPPTRLSFLPFQEQECLARKMMAGSVLSSPLLFDWHNVSNEF